jgi:hypothetical protein
MLDWSLVCSSVLGLGAQLLLMEFWLFQVLLFALRFCEPTHLDLAVPDLNEGSALSWLPCTSVHSTSQMRKQISSLPSDVELSSA